MGGEVLELMDERAERMRREGIEQGIERGREQGREQTLREMSERLAALGVDAAVIAEAARGLDDDSDGLEKS